MINTRRIEAPEGGNQDRRRGCLTVRTWRKRSRPDRTGAAGPTGTAPVPGSRRVGHASDTSPVVPRPDHPATDEQNRPADDPATDRDSRPEAPQPDDAGMSTVEYAVGTVVAAAFAAVLYKIVTGDSVLTGLTNLIDTALSSTF